MGWRDRWCPAGKAWGGPAAVRQWMRVPAPAASAAAAPSAGRCISVWSSAASALSGLASMPIPAAVEQVRDRGGGSGADERVEDELARLGQHADDARGYFAGEARRAVVVASDRGDLPDPAAAPLGPLVVVESVAVVHERSRVVEEQQVLPLVDGAVRARRPGVVLPGGRLAPDAVVVEVEARGGGGVLDDGGGAQHAGGRAPAGAVRRAPLAPGDGLVAAAEHAGDLLLRRVRVRAARGGDVGGGDAVLPVADLGVGAGRQCRVGPGAHVGDVDDGECAGAQDLGVAGPAARTSARSRIAGPGRARTACPSGTAGTTARGRPFPAGCARSVRGRRRRRLRWAAVCPCRRSLLLVPGGLGCCGGAGAVAFGSGSCWRVSRRAVGFRRGGGSNERGGASTACRCQRVWSASPRFADAWPSPRRFLS